MSIDGDKARRILSYAQDRLGSADVVAVAQAYATLDLADAIRGLARPREDDNAIRDRRPAVR